MIFWQLLDDLVSFYNVHQTKCWLEYPMIQQLAILRANKIIKSCLIDLAHINNKCIFEYALNLSLIVSDILG